MDTVPAEPSLPTEDAHDSCAMDTWPAEHAYMIDILVAMFFELTNTQPADIAKLVHLFCRTCRQTAEDTRQVQGSAQAFASFADPHDYLKMLMEANMRVHHAFADRAGRGEPPLLN